MAHTTKTSSCKCAAYPFPHRLHSGGCRYPDRPARVSTALSGKHAAGWKRNRRVKALPAWVRRLGFNSWEQIERIKHTDAGRLLMNACKSPFPNASKAWQEIK